MSSVRLERRRESETEATRDCLIAGTRLEFLVDARNMVFDGRLGDVESFRNIDVGRARREQHDVAQLLCDQVHRVQYLDQATAAY